ncbi:MAG TPA: hypothetical protein VHO24_05135 [Opitutaceae bacterium]|nr:hypothetical protein [Opitutaceae bacterium]
MNRSFSLRAIFFLLVWLGLAGCSIPTPGYRKVDPTTPAFREATARLSELLRAKGLTGDEADRRALEEITRQTVAFQKEGRGRQVRPLVRALEAFEAELGCWAYTVTTRVRTDGKLATTVETFDASKPESEIWTLVSRDGKPPDESGQSEYRDKKLRRWKKSLTRSKPRHMDPERMEHEAIFADFKMSGENAGQATRYSFSRGRTSIPVLGTVTSSRVTYLLDNASGQLVNVTTMTGPDSMLFGIKAVHYDTTVDYVSIEPELPPFIAKTSARYHFIAFGKDHGDVERETVYSDYRRVKCYEQRFNVRVGTPEVQDYLPD